MGVKQGENFSPTAFNCYINSLIDEISNQDAGIWINPKERVNILAYADDIVLIAASVKELNLLLKRLESWCNKWRVVVNTSKTKIVHFRKRKQMLTNSCFTLNGEELSKVDEYKYPGVVLTYCLDMTQTAAILATSGSEALLQLMGKTKSNYDLGYQSFSKLFQTTVVPVLDYAIGAWNNGCRGNPHAKMDQVQNRAIRYFCGAPKKVPIASIIGDMGWTPGVVRRDIENLQMFNQMVRMEDRRLTKKLFMSDRTHTNPTSWSANVKSICSSIGCLENWESLMPVNIWHATSKLMQWYNRAWESELDSKPKLCLYKEIKTEFKVEGYVKMNLSKVHQSLICKLWGGVLDLELERGCRCNVPRDAYLQIV